MHFGAGGGDVEEDVVTAFPIHGIKVGEDGVISVLTQDALDQPVAHQFDGNSKFVWSIYEAGDIWFQDPRDERVWYGIYDAPLDPGYVDFSEDEPM
jgi:hypothetical protein